MKVTAWDEVMEPLDRLERKMCSVSAEMLDVISELDAEWVDDPCVPDLASELAARHGITASLASERLRVARALRELPKLRRAHAEGRLSWDQLRWVTRFATPETDAGWAERAPGMRPGALQLEARRQERVRREKAERDHAMRSLRLEWDEERRFLYLQGCLAAEQGEAVEFALNRAAQNVELEEGVYDRRGARLADALTELVTSPGGARPQAPTLVIHADAEVVAGVRDGRMHLAETSRGTQLSDEAVRRLVCAAKVRWAIEQEGTPVGIASAGRGVTDQQMEMLLFRDRCCTFRGCERTWFLHAHHIRHWADGGKTTLSNLTLLCSAHHTKVHEGGWLITGRPGKDLRFHDPGNQRMPVRARQRGDPALARQRAKAYEYATIADSSARAVAQLG